MCKGLFNMFAPSAPAPLPPPPPPPEAPKPMLTPEEAARKKNDSTGSNRATSRNPLRIDLGGTGGSSGLNIPL